MARQTTKSKAADTAKTETKAATEKKETVKSISGRRHARRNQGEIYINYGPGTVSKGSVKDIYQAKDGSHSVVELGGKGNGKLIGRVAMLECETRKGNPVRVATFDPSLMAALKAHAENGRPLKRLLAASPRTNTSDNPDYAGLTDVAYQIGPRSDTILDGNPALKSGMKFVRNAEGQEVERPMTQAYVKGFLGADQVKHHVGETATGRPYDFWSFTIFAKGIPVDMTIPDEVVQNSPAVREIVRKAQSGQGSMVTLVADAWFKRPEFEGRKQNIRLSVYDVPDSMYEPYASPNKPVDDSNVDYKEHQEEAEAASMPGM